MGYGGVACFPTLSAAFSSDDSGDSAHTASEHWPAGGAAGGGYWGLPGHQLLPGVGGPCPQHAPPLLGHARAAAGGQGQSFPSCKSSFTKVYQLIYMRLQWWGHHLCSHKVDCRTLEPGVISCRCPGPWLWQHGLKTTVCFRPSPTMDGWTSSTTLTLRPAPSVHRASPRWWC